MGKLVYRVGSGLSGQTLSHDQTRINFFSSTQRAIHWSQQFYLQLYCLLLRISFFFYFFRKCCILAYEMEWRSIFLLQGLQCDIFYCCAALPILCFVLRMVLACYFCGAWREFTIGPAIKMSICFSTSWDFWILGVLWWNKFLDPGSFCGMNLLYIISFRKRDPGSFG